MSKVITIFGASSDRISEKYKSVSYELGKLIAEEGWQQFNGAGAYGVMGHATAGGIENGGEVHGVIIKVYEEFQDPTLTTCKSVSEFSERKKGLMDAADYIIALPGGIGTLSEIFHVWDDLLADIHRGSITTPHLILLNIDDFFTPLIEWIEDRIIGDSILELDLWHKIMTVCTDPSELIHHLKKPI